MGKYLINPAPGAATEWTHRQNSYVPGTVVDIPAELVAGFIERGVIGDIPAAPPSEVPVRRTQEVTRVEAERDASQAEVDRLNKRVAELEGKLSDAHNVFNFNAGSTPSAEPAVASDADRFKSDLAEALGPGPAYIKAANSLVDKGYDDYEKLFAASNEELAGIDGVGNSIIAAVRSLQKHLVE